jgi:DNA-binding transcriptional regulator YdaS (Cro superfamily)
MIHGIEALRRAKELLGSEAALAEVVGVRQPSVNYILNAGKRVPAEWCIRVEDATDGKVTRHQLRPDLYPADRESSAPEPHKTGEAA